MEYLKLCQMVMYLYLEVAEYVDNELEVVKVYREKNKVYINFLKQKSKVYWL